MTCFRAGHIGLFLICLGLMLAALYFEYQMGLNPCPLCWVQRGAVCAFGLVSLLAALHGPQKVGALFYTSLSLLVAAVGLSVSGRHVWLQSLPADQVPACGPDLAYIVEAFPFWEGLAVLLAGDGNCADVKWSFLGLSMPAWLFIHFVGLAVGVVMLYCWRNRSLPGR